jgi:hypothetical protein
MAVEPYFAQQLTELSLIRRDELLEASYSGNMIGIKGE